MRTCGSRQAGGVQICAEPGDRAKVGIHIDQDGRLEHRRALPPVRRVDACISNGWRRCCGGRPAAAAPRLHAPSCDFAKSSGSSASRRRGSRRTIGRGVRGGIGGAIRGATEVARRVRAASLAQRVPGCPLQGKAFQEKSGSCDWRALWPGLPNCPTQSPQKTRKETVACANSEGDQRCRWAMQSTSTRAWATRPLEASAVRAG